MKLFEITNGFIGDSYIRCYAWAKTLNDAENMFFKEHAKQLIEKHGPEAIEDIRIKELFDSSDKEFITELSDSGFEK